MNKLICILLLLLSFCSIEAQNKVIVNTQVLPPYSPYISTYVDQPNKLILIITNISAQPQNIKLWVRIAGDNGISATTAPGFKPSQPITLNAYEVKSIDFSSSETHNYPDP